MSRAWNFASGSTMKWIMSEIAELLSETIDSIIDGKEESDMDSLFKSGDTSLLYQSRGF